MLLSLLGCGGLMVKRKHCTEKVQFRGLHSEKEYHPNHDVTLAGAVAWWIECMTLKTDIVGSVPSHSKVSCRLFSFFFFFRLLTPPCALALSPNGLE